MYNKTLKQQQKKQNKILKQKQEKQNKILKQKQEKQNKTLKQKQKKEEIKEIKSEFGIIFNGILQNIKKEEKLKKNKSNKKL